MRKPKNWDLFYDSNEAIKIIDESWVDACKICRKFFNKGDIVYQTFEGGADDARDGIDYYYCEEHTPDWAMPLQVGE